MEDIYYTSLTDKEWNSIEDTTMLSPFEHVLEEQLHRKLTNLLLELSIRQEFVIRLRFGMLVERHEYSRVCTLKEIGDMLNVSSGYIGQVEKRALGKLRARMALNNIRAQDFL